MRHVGIFLLAFVAVVASGLLVTRPAPLVLEAHSSGAWAFEEAEAPKNWPKEHRLYAPCPWTPWAVPKKVEEHKA